MNDKQAIIVIIYINPIIPRCDIEHPTFALWLLLLYFLHDFIFYYGMLPYYFFGRPLALLTSGFQSSFLDKYLVDDGPNYP